MATEAELKAAARKALAAGNTASAKRLIEAARKAAAPATSGVAPSPAMQDGLGRLSAMSNNPVVMGANVSASAAQREADAAAARLAELNEEKTSAFASFAGSLAPGMTFGAADEIAAGIGSMFEERPYNEILSGLRLREKDLRETNPKSALAGNIVGAVSPGAAGVKLIAAARSMPQAIASGIGFGALAGGTQGFMEGEGGLANRAKNSIPGIVLGGALGGMIPVAGAGIQAGWRAGKEALAKSGVGANVGRDLGVSNRAGRVIADMIGRDDPAAMRAAIGRGGPTAMLADASPQATGMLDMALQSPTAGARAARGAIDDRASVTYKRITEALDNAMGKPQGLDAAQGAIRSGTASQRSDLYGKAFDAPIDWRSPQGEALRSLIGTTPDDVLRLAAKNRAMKARAPVIPDSAYAAEFAETVTSRPGPMAGDYAGKKEVESFFNDYTALAGEKMYKRPIAYTIKKLGGIDPTGKAAAELRQMGLNPTTAPALFRHGGMKDLDNLDRTRFPDSLPDDGTGNYVSRQALLDALESEARGVPVRSYEDAAKLEEVARMEELIPDYKKKKAAIAAEDRAMARGPTAPDAPSELVPTQTVYDVDQIKRALDEVKRTNDGKGLMGGQTEYGVEAGKRAKEMRDLLAEISPTYKEALSVSADTIARVDALKMGASMMSPSTTREAVREMIKDATGGELKAMREGARSQIDETLANVRAVASDQNIDARAAAKAFSDMSSPATQEKLSMVLGDAWPGLKAQLDEAGAALGLRARTSANSATFGRTASSDAVMEEVTPGALRRGQPVQAVRNLIASMMGASPDAIKRLSGDVKGELAEVLTRQGVGPDMIDRILDAINRRAVAPNSGARIRSGFEATALGNVGTVTEQLRGLIGQPR